jgi:hypothetical protein
MRMTGFRRIQRGKWHSYELDGVRLPSVTKLIGDGVPKKNLIDWAARAAAEFAADNLDQLGNLDRAAAVDMIRLAHNRARNTAATKGVDIHALAQRLAEGQAVDVPDTIGGYLDAHVAFLTDWHLETIALEAAVVSRRWAYAGTFDILGTLPGVGACVIDIKTGGSGIWPETCLQVAAYRHADAYINADGHEQPMPQTAAGFGLQLVDDGTYELVPVESGPDIFAVFLHVAHVAAFCNRPKDDLVGLPVATPQGLPA